MKRNIKSAFITAIAATALLSLTSCKKILEERPRAQITPEFFATPDGIEGGIAGAYSNLRNLWGTENFTNYTQGGTDEVLAGGSNNNAYLFTYDATFSSRSNDFGAMWDIFYQNINALNGILQFGAVANMDTTKKAQLLAQAKFLRAFSYFHLVQSFGDVPLHLEFITTPSTADSRQPIAEVYDAIIKDLTEAAADLPAMPAPGTGKPAYKATALYLLAKTYLTRGWSTAAQPTDFQMAYTTAANIITNKAVYGLDLWPDYAQVNREGNEYGRETLMVIDHNRDPKYGEYTVGQAAAGPKENKSNFYQRPNYPTVNANYPAPGGDPVIDRDIPNGRPFIRIRPNTSYAMDVAFADKVNDYRYEKTFQTYWITNRATTTPRGTLIPGVDTAIWMPGRLVAADERARFKGVIFEPDNLPGATTPYTPAYYPSMRKYDDSTRLTLNDASDRPYILFKFSEVYLIAAEAAFKGGATIADAANLLNVIRQRAAYRPTNTPEQNAAAVAAQTITADQVTLDFILDERTRELYGESLRWWDLVRTQSLVRRVQQYNNQGGANIQPFHALRPIPQAQIDLTTSGPKFPQNPGY